MVVERQNKGDKIWFDDDFNVVFSLKSQDSSGNEFPPVTSRECKLGSKTLLPVVGKAIRTMTKGETAIIQVNEHYSFSDGCDPSIAPSPQAVTLTLTLEDGWKVRMDLYLHAFFITVGRFVI